MTASRLTETLKLSVALETEVLKNLVDIAYNRFDDDFTLAELESLERAADIIGNAGISAAVRNRIEKGNYV